MPKQHQSVGAGVLVLSLSACGVPALFEQPSAMESAPRVSAADGASVCLDGCAYQLVSDGAGYSSIPASERIGFESSLREVGRCAELAEDAAARPPAMEVALLAPAAAEPAIQVDAQPPILPEPVAPAAPMAAPAAADEPVPVVDEPALEPTSVSDTPATDPEPVAEESVPETPPTPANAPAGVVDTPQPPMAEPVVGKTAAPAKPVPRATPDAAALVHPPPPRSSLPRLRSSAVLHATASRKSAAVTTLPADSPVQLMRSVRNAEGDWWYVKAVGESGWILAPAHQRPRERDLQRARHRRSARAGGVTVAPGAALQRRAGPFQPRF